MASISMKYNPFKVETLLNSAGMDLMEETKFSKFKGERLQVWVEELFSLLEEVLNEDVFDLTFTGMLLDFEDIVSSAEQYHKLNSSVSINLNHIPVQETADKFTELEELVDMMQEGPFETLRDPKIRQNFEKALNSEFEIAVIATMSSGKSTLINSLLGRDLMPAKNEACTAKISKIYNKNNLNNFSAVAYDIDGHAFKSITDASVEDFEEFNNDPNIALVEIEGNIPSISSGKMNLVLVDTPGPNNSMDCSHREHTLTVIKSDDKPMVLYVLNATQLRTDDDFALLRTVADAMAVGGKQSKDRFIFAVNKADVFDPEKGEYLSDALENVRVYLEQQGIENPNIYPVSAQTAKVIRKAQNGYELTRQERRSLQSIDLFLEEETMHLNKYAPVSVSLQNSINKKIKLAQQNNDDQTEALYYTGIPSVEAAINEYLEKYAVTSKITNAVNTFKRIVEQQQFMQNLQEELSNNEEERIKIQQAMEHIEQQLAQGIKATQFKEKIKNMSFDVTGYFEDLNEKVFGKQLNGMMAKLRGDRIKKVEADILLYKLEKEILMLQDDAVTDLQKIISSALRKSAEGYLREYQQYVSDIMDFEMNSINIADWDKAITADTPNIESLLDDFSYIEREVVGTRTKKNENKKWYKPWTWGQDSEYEVDVYDNVEYVNLNQVRDTYIVPVVGSLRTNFKNAQEFMESELKKLQVYFLNEINRLEDIMKQRVKDIKKLAQNSEQLEEELENKKLQKEWLEVFVAKLDTILELHEKVGVEQ